jgi:hypothetical protein
MQEHRIVVLTNCTMATEVRFPQNLYKIKSRKKIAQRVEEERKEVLCKELTY